MHLYTFAIATFSTAANLAWITGGIGAAYLVHILILPMAVGRYRLLS